MRTDDFRPSDNVEDDRQASASRGGGMPGGAGGLGAALCRRYTRDGAKVAVVDLDRGACQAVADDIGGIAIAADVRDEAQVRKVVETTERELGPIDLDDEVDDTPDPAASAPPVVAAFGADARLC